MDRGISIPALSPQTKVFFELQEILPTDHYADLSVPLHSDCGRLITVGTWKTGEADQLAGPLVYNAHRTFDSIRPHAPLFVVPDLVSTWMGWEKHISPIVAITASLLQPVHVQWFVKNVPAASGIYLVSTLSCQSAQWAYSFLFLLARTRRVTWLQQSILTLPTVTT